MAGYQLMVSNDVLRGRFRKGFETPQPITPNRVEEFDVDLHTQNYKFLKGHRIMVQVQSTWFPSSTEIRRPSCRTFSRRTTVISKRRHTESSARRAQPPMSRCSMVGAMRRRVSGRSGASAL